MGDSYSEWPGLKGDQNFVFTPELATQCAELCAGMLWAVEQVKNQMISKLEVPRFSPEASGERMSIKFSMVSDRLRDVVLPDHETLLNDMASAFLMARRAVGQNEENSAADFNGIKDRVTSAPGYSNGRQFSPRSVEVPNWGNAKSTGGDGAGIDFYNHVEEEKDGNTTYTNIVSRSVVLRKYYLDKLADLSEMKTLDALVGDAHETMPVEPEPGITMDWNRYFAHYEAMSLPSGIDKILESAGNWKGVADFLESERARFVGGIAGTFNNEGWTGGSGPAARAAVERYGQTTTELVNSLRAIATNLGTAVGWLRGLQVQLPTESAADFIKRHDNDPLAAKTVEPYYAAKWDEWYGVGLRATSDNIPILSVPSMQKPKVEVPGPGTTNLGNGGGGPTSPGTTNAPNLTTDPNNGQPVNPGNPSPAPKEETPATDNSLKDVAELASTLLSSGSEALTSVVEQGVTGLQSLVSQGTTALQQLMQQTTTNTDNPVNPTVNPITQNDPSKQTGTGGGGGGGGGTPKGGGTAPKLTASPQSTLFPRATVSSETSTTTSRAGLASTTSGTTQSTPMTGAPMGGAGAGAGQGQGKEYKRPEYLRSGENFDEALGAMPEAVTPVAEK